MSYGLNSVPLRNLIFVRLVHCRPLEIGIVLFLLYGKPLAFLFLWEL